MSRPGSCCQGSLRNLLALSILIAKGIRLRKRYQQQKAARKGRSLRKPTAAEKGKGKAPCETNGRTSETEKNEREPNVAKETYQHIGLPRILTRSIDAIIAARLIEDYGNYMAPNTLKIGSFDGKLWTSCSDESWQDILQKVGVELENKKAWRQVQDSGFYSSRDNDFKNPAPCIPFTKILLMAASEVDMTLEQMVFEIQDYLSRKQPSHMGVRQCIETCSWAQLARRLIQDKEIAELIFRARPNEGSALKKAISEIENRWFEPGLNLGTNKIVVVSTEAMIKSLKLRKSKAKKSSLIARLKR